MRIKTGVSKHICFLRCFWNCENTHAPIPAYRTAQMADRRSGKNTHAHSSAYWTAQMADRRSAYPCLQDRINGRSPVREKYTHIPCFLQKFHPQLNPIERVWAQLKRFTKAHCKYSFPSLRKDIPLAYDSVTVENIRHHFRKVRHYMFCYLECLTPGKELYQALLKYKTAVKSNWHQRITPIFPFLLYTFTAAVIHVGH